MTLFTLPLYISQLPRVDSNALLPDLLIKLLPATKLISFSAEMLAFNVISLPAIRDTVPPFCAVSASAWSILMLPSPPAVKVILPPAPPICLVTILPAEAVLILPLVVCSVMLRPSTNSSASFFKSSEMELFACSTISAVAESRSR